MKLFNKISVAALLALVAVSASAKGSPPKDSSLPIAPCMIAVEYEAGKKEYFNANLISKIGVYSYTAVNITTKNEERFNVSVNAGSTYRSFDQPSEAAAIKFADKIVADIEAKCK